MTKYGIKGRYIIEDNTLDYEGEPVRIYTIVLEVGSNLSTIDGVALFEPNQVRLTSWPTMEEAESAMTRILTLGKVQRDTSLDYAIKISS